MLSYSETAGLIFTFVPLKVSLTIAVVIVTGAVVPSAYVTVIVPPFNVNVSPCSNVTSVGAVIAMFVTPFFTVILNVVVFPSYVTVTAFVPALVVNVFNGVNVTPVSVKLTVPAFPTALVTITSPPVKSYAASFIL